jgi:hypothetical protein
VSLRTKTAACAANISPACYHFAAVQCYWSTMISMIYCPVLKSLQPQLPLLSFTASTSFWPSLFWKLFSLERGRPCECVQQCWSQQDEWNRGPSFPSFISKLWLNSYIIYYVIPFSTKNTSKLWNAPGQRRRYHGSSASSRRVEHSRKTH